jgi:hypothetical protein
MSLLSSKKTGFVLSLIILSCFSQSLAQQRRVPAGGQRAVVVEERLAALRDEPGLTARLLQRMSRGRMVAIIGTKRSPEGVTFYRVAVTRRTRGWLQSDAVVLPGRAGDDERLLRLVRASEDFDRIMRARIFLDLFPKSSLRPAILMIYGEAAEEAAEKLSRDAARRLEEREMTANGAPLFSYFMNFNGLDRYNRQGITFVFDQQAKRFRYDGESWREVVRRYPRSPEATDARKRLESLAAKQGR